MCRFPETLLVFAKPRESLYRQALNAEPQTKSRILKPQPCAHNRIAVVPMDTDKQISHQSFVCGPRLSVREVAVPCRGVLQSDRKPGTVSHVGGRCAFRSPKAATAPCSVLSRRGSSWKQLRRREADDHQVSTVCLFDGADGAATVAGLRSPFQVAASTSEHMFNENSILMKMQFKAIVTQFLFVR